MVTRTEETLQNLVGSDLDYISSPRGESRYQIGPTLRISLPLVDEGEEDDDQLRGNLSMARASMDDSNDSDDGDEATRSDSHSFELIDLL